MIDVAETVIVKKEYVSEEESNTERYYDESNHDVPPSGFDLEAVKERWETTTESGGMIYRCDICLTDMFDLDSVTVHYKKHFTVPFSCHICSKTLTRLYGLRRHIRRKHFVDNCRVTNAEGVIYYICDICGLPSTTAEDFQKHYRPHINEKSAACDVCDKTFSSLNALKKHKASVHFAVKFPCDICGREFSTQWTLTDHTNLHLNRRPYKCVVCGKDYASSSGLNSHVCTKDCKGQNSYSQHVTNKIEVKEYFCHICIVSFADKQELTRHFFLKHKKERQENMNKNKKYEVVTEGGVVKYKCEFCEMVFDYIRTMKTHRKKMHGKNQLTCDVCEKVFPCLRRLQWHQDQKHVKKKIPCDVCGKMYSSGPSMKQHKQKFHVNCS